MSHTAVMLPAEGREQVATVKTVFSILISHPVFFAQHFAFDLGKHNVNTPWISESLRRSCCFCLQDVWGLCDLVSATTPTNRPAVDVRSH